MGSCWQRTAGSLTNIGVADSKRKLGDGLVFAMRVWDLGGQLGLLEYENDNGPASGDE